MGIENLSHIQDRPEPRWYRISARTASRSATSYSCPRIAQSAQFACSTQVAADLATGAASSTLRRAGIDHPGADASAVQMPDSTWVIRTWRYLRSGRLPPPSWRDRQAIITIRDRNFPSRARKRVKTPVRFLRTCRLPNRRISGASLEPPAQLYPPRSGASGRNSQTFSSEGIKVPSAFLISICGLKGRRVGGAQVNENQPLVLLNQGGATAEDVLALASQKPSSPSTR